MIIRKIIVHIALLYLIVGCASFPKEQVQKVNTLPDVSGYSNKPSAFFDLRFYRGEPDRAKPVEVPQAMGTIQPIVESAIKESNLFGNYTFDASRKDGMDHRIRIRIYNHANVGGAAIAGFLCGFTFGVIPAAATDNYAVIIETLDKQDNVIDIQRNNDAMTTWMGIWFIPAAGNTPQKALRTTIKNQVLDALVKLKTGNVLKYSEAEKLDFTYACYVTGNA